MLHSSLCPLSDRLQNCINLCLLYCALWCSNKSLSTLLFSVAIRHLEYTGSHQHSEIGKTEISLLGSPCKIWNVADILQLFPFLGRIQELGVFIHSFYIEPRGEVTVSECYNHCLWFPTKDAFSCQHLDSGKTEADPLDSPFQKVRMLFVWSRFFPKRSW